MSAKLATAFAATIAYLAVGFFPTPAAASTRSENLDMSIPAKYTLGVCESALDSDCVQSVGVIVDGQLFEADWKSDTFFPARTDGMGNLNLEGVSRWSASTPLGETDIAIIANLETPTHACCMFPGNVVKRFGSLRTEIQVDDPLTTKVWLQVRTSWLKPLNVAMSMSDAEFSQTPSSVGNLWTLQGTGIKVSAYNSGFAEKFADALKADSDQVWFRFVIDHAGESDELSPYSKKCSEFGYTVAAQNSSAAGKPTWNPSDLSLDFNIFAPHLRADGSLNRGYFKFWGHLAYFDCLFPGNSIRSASSVKVQVFSEDGETQVATVVGSIKQGLLMVEAFDFHYSSPTIKASLSRPIIRSLSTFTGTAFNLTSKQKEEIRTVISQARGSTKFICTGIRLEGQPQSFNTLVRKRAKLACEYAKSLNPALSTFFQTKTTNAPSYNGKVLVVSK